MNICLVKKFEHLLADENWKPQVPVAELYKGLSQLQVAFDDDHADDDADEDGVDDDDVDDADGDENYDAADADYQ